jgi:hypothetical protein
LFKVLVPSTQGVSVVPPPHALNASNIQNAKIIIVIAFIIELPHLVSLVLTQKQIEIAMLFNCSRTYVGIGVAQFDQTRHPPGMRATRC